MGERGEAPQTSTLRNSGEAGVPSEPNAVYRYIKQVNKYNMVKVIAVLGLTVIYNKPIGRMEYLDMIKTIGVLTSGGDAPGMNAAVRAVARTAISRGIKVYGIRRGYNGLINGDIIEMNERSVSDILQKDGTTMFSKEANGIRFVKKKHNLIR